MLKGFLVVKRDPQIVPIIDQVVFAFHRHFFFSLSAVTLEPESFQESRAEASFWAKINFKSGQCAVLLVAFVRRPTHTALPRRPAAPRPAEVFPAAAADAPLAGLGVRIAPRDRPEPPRSFAGTRRLRVYESTSFATSFTRSVELRRIPPPVGVAAGPDTPPPSPLPPPHPPPHQHVRRERLEASVGPFQRFPLERTHLGSLEEGPRLLYLPSFYRARARTRTYRRAREQPEFSLPAVEGVASVASR